MLRALLRTLPEEICRRWLLFRSVPVVVFVTLLLFLLRLLRSRQRRSQRARRCKFLGNAVSFVLLLLEQVGREGMRVRDIVVALQLQIF